jgi:hypothetical protein
MSGPLPEPVLSQVGGPQGVAHKAQILRLLPVANSLVTR